MSAPTSPAKRTRRSRKSIAHIPDSSTGFDQENSMASQQMMKPGKKSRSKSLGPGGLEALKASTGNSQKLIPAIRSILKPAIPLSPPKAIPPRTPKTNHSKQTGDTASPTRKTRSASRPSQSPTTPAASESTGGQTTESAELVVLRTEEEQQAAARARDREEAIRRRDERRKSLANRRVSFAPEATLHTWDVVELNEDATTSSEATNSTRRQSSGNTLGSDFTHGTQHPHGSDPADAVMEHEGSLPDLPREEQRAAGRRTSGVTPTENELSSSPGSIMNDDDTQSSFVTNPEEEIDDLSDTDTYRDDDSTAMDIDEDDPTNNSIGSARTDNTSGSNSSGTLDARLRQAIQQAGTQRLGDTPDTRGRPQDDETTSLTSAMRQKRRNESLLDADLAADRENGNDETTGVMEMTQAVGGILHKDSSRSPSRRSSRSARRRSSGVSSDMDDQTMDMTTAVGGIRRGSPPKRRDSVATVATEDEDMSMELTGVIGGFVNPGISNFSGEDTISDRTTFENMTGQMDVTTAFGRILSPVTERTELSTEASASMDFTTAVGAITRTGKPEDSDFEETMDITSTMDVTKAIGRIIPADLRPQDRATAKRLLEEETEHGQLSRSPFTKQLTYPTLPSPRPEHRSPPVEEMSQGQETTPSPGGRHTTPVKATHTPTHQITPQPAPRPTTPSKTPPNKNVAMRRTSPRKLFSQSTRERQGASNSPAIATGLQNRRATIDPSNMNITLTPQLRRLSGQGADQAGLGSPKVAALLDRRTSIGEAAKSFTPQGPASRGVRFANPQELEQELDEQREEDRFRESGQRAFVRESDPHQDKDATLTITDMISGLTPKKQPKKDLKGRKSLAVGSGRGLLGKRPVELDDDDQASPKRLQGPDRSPVKSIKLPAPPSKEETTGRISKLSRLSLGLVSGNTSTPVTEEVPSKPTTPRHQQRFRDAAAVEHSVDMPTAPSDIAGDVGHAEDDDVEPIQLQEFLNLINVRFMDLETTKRRHTLAPRDRTSTDTSLDDRNLEDCIVAGVSTVPMLELYQHSCRELKKYISEGRNIVREIETDTFEDNPALFKEYTSASLDVRAIMDNQFKNVKSHARLQSREMWYEWRGKLLEGLKDGLIKIAEGLVHDSDALSKQEQLLFKVAPGLVERFGWLSGREETLHRQAKEFEMSDQDELKHARQELASADAQYEEKKRLLAELRAERESYDEHLGRLNAKKQQCLSEIAESQKLCDEYRGWKMAEVAALKAEVDALGESSGWSIASVTKSHLELHYRRALSLLLNPASFRPATAEPCSIKLSLVSNAEPSTQERFFIQLLRAHLHALDQASTIISEALTMVSSGWDIAMRLRNSVSDLTLGYITDVAITGDESLSICAHILLREMRTKVQVNLDVKVQGSGTKFITSTRTATKVVYGEELKEGRMGDFLSSKIGADKEEEFNKWSDAVRELETRLIARGKK